jgi:outer membrane lipoprotein SlyB
MRKTLAFTALAGLIALPLIAGPTAADASCQSRKTTGTVLGGVGGALLGNSVSHGGGGAVLGGLGGAVVGHQIGKSGCNDRRAYYRDRRHHEERQVRYDRHGNRYYR